MTQFDWTFLERIGGHPFIVLGLLLAIWLYQKLCRRFTRCPRVPLGMVTLALLLFLIEPFIAQIGNAKLTQSTDVISTLALYLGILRAAVFFVVDYILQQRRGIKVPSITSDLVLTIVWFLAIMVVLRQKLDFDLASLITTSAILTAVIGFALQDTLGNLFAGLAIQAEHPFQLGDWVQLGQHIGRVEGISWKSTKVVTTNRETVYIPNSNISKAAIFNYSQPTPEYIATMSIGLSYDAPPNQVRHMLLDVISQHPQILHDRQSEVRIQSFADSSILYQLRFWVNNYATADKIKNDLFNHIWYRCQREAIRIPYPVREMIQATPKNTAPATSAIEELLDSIELFSAITEEDRKLMAGRVHTQLFGAGEEIVKQGSPGETLYIILHGQCRILVSINGGPNKPVAILKQGDFFGEMSLLTGEPRAATVIAEEETRCLIVCKDDVKDILLAKPEITKELSKVLAQRQAEISGLSQAQHDATKETRSQQILGKIWDFLKT